MSNPTVSSIAPSSFPGSRPRKVAFETLPRIVREHFVASTSETFPPWPILRAHPVAPAARAWIMVSLAALAVLFLAIAAGFGDPHSQYVTHPRWAALLFGLLCATAVGALLRAIAARNAHNLPFRAGVYLFPSEVIDARSGVLGVYSLAQLATIDHTASEVRLRFADGHSFVFPVPNEAAGVSAVEAALRARDALEDAHNAPSLLGLVDPLYAPCKEIPTVPNTPTRVGPVLRIERNLALAVALGALLGGSIYSLREAASDRVAYGHARARGDIASLRDYASNGRARVGEVRSLHLPLAELRVLTQTVEIEAWMAAHPVAAATAEAREHRMKALLRDLDRFSTVTEVRAFALRYELDPSKSLARLHGSALARHSEGVITKLLPTPDACGTAIAIEVVRGEGSLTGADHAVSMSRRYAGTPSLPSRYLATAPEAERAARERIEDLLRRSFPEGCLTTTKVAPGTPRLRITWTPRATGVLVETANPPAVFTEVDLRVDLRLIGGDGVELARRGRSFAAKITEADLMMFSTVKMRVPGDDRIERRAYDDVMKTLLLLAAEDATAWLGAATDGRLAITQP